MNDCAAPVATPRDLLLTCKRCQHEFRVPAAVLNQSVECPHCHKIFFAVPVGAAVSDPLVGKELAGCRLLRRLGAGGLGVVYEAEQLAVGRSVAIKMLSNKAAAIPTVVQRFQREAQLCAALNHPHVVGVYDCGQDRGVHYLLMEYVRGETLAARIQRAGRLPWQEAVGFAMQIAKALSHAHSRDIIHRDIKPANILIDHDGTAKLADLGLAKQLTEVPDAEGGLTMQGAALGSPAYMPPEQIRDARSVTKAADVYALGVTLYHALAGKRPYTGTSAAEVMGCVLNDPPPDLAPLAADVPAGVLALVERMMAKDALARPVDAPALIVEFEATLAEPTRAPARRCEATVKASGSSWSWLLPALIVVALVLGAVLLTALAFRR